MVLQLISVVDSSILNEQTILIEDNIFIAHLRLSRPSTTDEVCIIAEVSRNKL